LVVMPLMIAILGFILSRAVPLFQVMQVRIDRINQVMREQITGVRVIRAFDRTPAEQERFETANAELTATALRVNRVFARAQPSRPLIGEAGVDLRAVTFGYPGSESPVVHDITLTLRPGETSAIIGGTGSGKTTLLNLMTRFFDPTSGEVLVGGVDVRQQSL